MFDNWDTAGQEVYGGLRDGYYIGVRCAIIMFDVTSMTTYNNVEKWYRDLSRVCEGIPIVLIANKVDVKDRAVTTKKVSFHRKRNLPYIEMSAKSNYNIDKPYITLLQKLVAPDIKLTAQTAVKPPEIFMDPKYQDQLNIAMQQANLPQGSF